MSTMVDHKRRLRTNGEIMNFLEDLNSDSSSEEN